LNSDRRRCVRRVATRPRYAFPALMHCAAIREASRQCLPPLPGNDSPLLCPCRRPHRLVRALHGHHHRGVSARVAPPPLAVQRQHATNMLQHGLKGRGGHRAGFLRDARQAQRPFEDEGGEDHRLLRHGTRNRIKRARRPPRKPGWPDTGEATRERAGVAPTPLCRRQLPAATNWARQAKGTEARCRAPTHCLGPSRGARRPNNRDRGAERRPSPIPKSRHHRTASCGPKSWAPDPFPSGTGAARLGVGLAPPGTGSVQCVRDYRQSYRPPAAHYRV